MIVAVNFS